MKRSFWHNAGRSTGRGFMADESKEERAGGAPASELEPTLELLRRSTTSRPSAEGAGADTSASIGRYSVLEEVARGGMGAILRVRDDQMRRTLAMKVVLDPGRSQGPSVLEDLDDARVVRFLEEAQVTGQLEHPGIVPVHELGLDDQGRLYFTMRLVKGRTLEEIFELARDELDGWTRTRALNVIQKVCEAMAYAHEKRVMHRDLKPANIMVGRFGETYVMDWGLAKLLDRQETNEDRRQLARFTSASLLTSERTDESRTGASSPFATLDGAVVGTPSYMAPEQARGDTETIGPSSDIYSAGAILYHLLAGEMPYVRGDAKVAPATILQWAMDGPPRPVQELAPDAPGELVAICEKAMARRAEDRYATMLELADELRAFLEGRVVRAYETGAIAEFRKWVGRNRGLATAASVAAIAVVGGLAWNGWSQARANERLSVANSALDEANREAEDARDRALASEAEAKDSAREALASATEASWQGYAANIAAANASLDLAAAGDARNRLAACPEELRGWEWEHLSLRSSSALLVLRGHESMVWTAAYSPDGRYVASGSGNYGDTGGLDFSVRIWNAESGELVHVLEGHTGRVTSLAFSPSGTELASAGLDQNVFVWDVERGVQLGATAGSTVAYLPDGTRLLTANWAQDYVSIWNMLDDTSRLIDKTGLRGRTVAVSPDGELAAAGLDTGVTRVYELETGAVLHELDSGDNVGGRGPDDWWNSTTSLDFDGSGERLLTAGGSGEVKVWSVATGELELTLAGHVQAVTNARFSAEGKWIVSSGLDGTLRFWDGTTGEALEVLHGHDGAVAAMDVGPVADRIVSGSLDKTLRVWDGQPGAATTLFVGMAIPNFRPFGLAFSPDGTRLAWRPGDLSVRISDTRTGEDLIRMPGLGGHIAGMGFSADGRRLLAITNEGVLSDRDAATGELRSPVLELGISTRRAWFYAGGDRLLVTASNPSRVITYDVESGEPLSTFDGLFSNYDAVVFDEGRRALIATNRTLRSIDLETGEVHFEIDAPGVEDARPYDVHGQAVHPTERLFVEHHYDSRDNTLRVRDLDTGELVRELVGHSHPSCVAFHPDGSRIVTGNWDGTVSLWDLERGEIASLRGPTSSVVFDVAFGPDGRRIASTQGGRYVLWETTSPVERETERRRAAARRWLEPKARLVVDPLIAELGLAPDVVARIERDASLDDVLRETAVRLARAHEPDYKELYYLARSTINRPDGSPDEYARALRIAEFLNDEVRSVDTRSDSAYLLGAALYRMGRYEPAAETLAAVLDGLAASPGYLSELVAFCAMAQARAGSADEARRTLAERPTGDIERFYEAFPVPFEQAFAGIPELMREAERVVAEAR